VSELGLALAAERARRGKPTSLDLNRCPYRPAARSRLERLLPSLTLLQLSETAADALAAERGAACDHTALLLELAAQVPWVVVTRGERGVLAAERRCCAMRFPAAAPSTVVDSSGAGDAFAAAWIRAWLEGKGLEEACEAGTRAGARACEALGARGWIGG
jgi:sugar/nucleoside kinase (ribokinase family)